jgi:hypothetical protein
MFALFVTYDILEAFLWCLSLPDIIADFAKHEWHSSLLLISFRVNPRALIGYLFLTSAIIPGETSPFLLLLIIRIIFAYLFVFPHLCINLTSILPGFMLNYLLTLSASVCKGIPTSFLYLFLGFFSTFLAQEIKQYRMVVFHSIPS